MSCVALVTYKLMIICKINDLSAKYVNLKKNLIIRLSGLSPSSGMVVWKKYFEKNILRIAEIRFGEHLRSVEEEKHLSAEYQDDDDINVAIHFTLPNHSIDHMGISALLYAPTEKLPRKTLEKTLIYELGTITPSGLNKQFSFLF